MLAQTMLLNILDTHIRAIRKDPQRGTKLGGWSIFERIFYEEFV